MEQEVYYGITYKKEQLNEQIYLFLPQGLVEGVEVGNTFYTREGHHYPILEKTNDFDDIGVVVDDIHTKKELLHLYNFDDIEFLKEYVLELAFDSFLLIQKEKDKITKRKMDITKCLLDSAVRELYSKAEEDIVVLNDAAFFELLNIQDLEMLKQKIKSYQKKLASFKEKNKKDGITEIEVLNGKVKNIKTEKGKKQKVTPSASSPSLPTKANETVSLQGLECYIKERVFGQTENIRKIAKTIYMNYTAIAGEKVEPILLIGPTGTGKTETMKVAMEYLDIPFIEVNSINLVPQGIKGTSLEDCLHLLALSAGLDIPKAERGTIFFDEFDKLGSTATEHKGDIIPIMLKFIEGTTFSISSETVDDYPFNTGSLNKVFAGAFSDLFTSSQMGFSPGQEEQIAIGKRLVKREYFGKELITRIPHILLYSELSREEKIRYLLQSKLSPILLKKKRYERQFAVELIAEDTYVHAILDKMEEEEKSMRELNNKVLSTLEEAEYELASSPLKYKKLILTRDTVENPTKFTLI